MTTKFLVIVPTQVSDRSCAYDGHNQATMALLGYFMIEKRFQQLEWCILYYVDIDFVYRKLLIF